MPDFTTPEGKKLNSIIQKLQNQINSLTGAVAKPQLTNSSIDVNEGRGFIPVIENGEIKMRIGRQPDGSIASVTADDATSLPPIVPYAPVCTPVLGGVQVRCAGFISKQFSNFSHVKVYRDQAFYGTIVKVPGSIVVAPLSPGPHQFKLSSVNLAGKESELTEAVVAEPKQVLAEDVADGIITTLKLANEAVTAAKVAVDAIGSEQIADQAVGITQIQDGAISTDKIAANAITSNKIAANTIQAVNIAANAIQTAAIAAASVNADKIASNAVTSDKIAANAITALQIAANAISATNIQAGSVDASKLATQLLLATNQIIVGSTTGARLVLDSQGLTQYDARGNLAVQFGAQANKSNYLTIIDPTDPSNALASIASDGSISMTGASMNGRVTLNGVDLVQYLNSLPKGVISQGTMTASTPYYNTAGNIGIFELQADVVAGRTYRFSTSPISIFINTPAPGGAIFGLRATFDGSIPSVSSQSISVPLYVYCYTTNSSFINYFVPPTTGRARLLFTAYSSSEVNSSGGTTRQTNFQVTAPLQFTIEDLGYVYQNTGGVNSGQGVTNANGTYTRVFKAIAGGSGYSTYTGVGGPNSINSGYLYQGQLNGVDYYSRLDFNFNDIRATLAGATINKAELYLYSYYWTDATGGWVSLGQHNVQQTNSIEYSYVFRSYQDLKMAKPDSQWLQIDNGYVYNIMNNYCTGFVLDARGSSSHNTPTNYGQFRRSADQDGEAVTPRLRVTYTK